MASEDIPTWVKVAMAVVLFAIAIGSTVGGVAWAMSRDSATHSYVVESLLKTDQRHDNEISANKKEIASTKDKQHKEELARTRLEGKIDLSIASQQATTQQVTEIKNEFKDFTKYLKQFNYEKKKEVE